MPIWEPPVKQKAPMVEVVVVSFLEKLGTFIATQSDLIWGVGDDIRWLRDELTSMRALLRQVDADPLEDEGLKSWVGQVRDVVYDAEDVIDEFILERQYSLRQRRRTLTRLTSYACLASRLKTRHEIASKIQGIRSRLEEISRRKSQYKVDRRRGLASNRESINGSLHLLSSSPLVHEGDLVGVEKHMDLLLGLLLKGEQRLKVISLVGMGGVGKTSLVKTLYNAKEVQSHFESCAWVHVSQTLSIRKVLEEMLRGLMQNPMEVKEFSERQLQERISNYLSGKRYMVVFDDVWNVQICRAVKLVLPRGNYGSRVILTTRNSNVASSLLDGMDLVHNLQPLSAEESWALFCNKVFGSNEGCPLELEETARALVSKCDGLPLAVVTMGGLMSRKEKTQLEWQRIVSNIQKILTHHGDGIRQALQTSYSDLPCFLKSCFLYCSMLPPNREVSTKRLIRLWVAEGFIQEVQGEFMEEIAENYLRELIDRSMFQVAKVSTSGRIKTFRIHDLVHQLAISISEKESFGKTSVDPSTCSLEKIRRIAVPNQKGLQITWKRSELHSLRSFFLFGSGEASLDHLSNNFKLLRVLELGSTWVKKLPSALGDLIHLRYLGLNGTRIKKLPESLKNLHNLQTLDVRKTNLKALTFGISNLYNLRHLEMRQCDECIDIGQGVGSLTKLQVITGVQYTQVIAQELGKLTQLRKLGIEGVRYDNVLELCSSINMLTNLSSLAMFSEDNIKPLPVETLKPPSFLQKLHLVGSLGKLPVWLDALQNLTKLRLGLSELSDDPMPILEALPHLSFLQLYESYKGKELRCSCHGFPRLKVMILTELEELEQWSVDKGAMPTVQEIWIMSCLSLRMVPYGFMFLSSLQKLRLVSMSEVFLERLNNLDGEDYKKIQHIPTIQLLDF